MVVQTDSSSCGSPRMDKKILSTAFSQLMVLFMVSLLVFPELTMGVDPYYYNCTNPESKTCGDGQLISYPFFIQGKQDSFCGFPGFNLTCNINGQPILKLQDTNFVITEINYTGQSIRVSNAVVSNTDSSSSCLPPLRNVSFPEEKFYLPSHDQTDDLFLLYNCNYSGTDKLDKYKLNCSSLSDATLAVFGGDSLLGFASSKCENAVEVPVDPDGSGDDDQGEVVELVRRGLVLNWVGSNCSECEESGGRCGFDETTYFVKCFCTDQPHALHCKAKPTKIIVAIIASAASGIGLIVIVICSLLWRSHMKNSKQDQSIQAFLIKSGPLPITRYRYREIKKMTRSYRDKLGEGGFGTVFKGKLADGRLVAVKVLKESKRVGEDFINEVASISRTSHVNIVTLLGFCFDGPNQALVYEFMPNGSLEKYIRRSALEVDCLLTWGKLHEVAIGIAQGLEYLHRGCNTRILHFDIKPHNILLDENLRPKVSDFGLAKICPERQSIISFSGARGTAGYIAPEVIYRNFGGVSHKSDVYSYGMLVLEMAGIRSKEIDVSMEMESCSEVYFPDWIYKRIEPTKGLGLAGIECEEDGELARRLVIVSLWCIQTRPSDRPSMSRVIEMLQPSFQPLVIPPRPYLYSPPRSQQGQEENSSNISTVHFD